MQRFAQVLQTIDVPEQYAGLQSLCICRDAQTGGTAMVKRGFGEWLERTEREADVHSWVQAAHNATSRVLPMLANWREPDCHAIATQYVRDPTLASLLYDGEAGDAASGNLRRTHVTAARVTRWIDSAFALLHWLHARARVVHGDAKTDNFFVRHDDMLQVFDFDECWPRYCFDGSQRDANHNFRTLCQSDYAFFLFNLEQDLQATGREHLVPLVRARNRHGSGRLTPLQSYQMLRVAVRNPHGSVIEAPREQEQRGNDEANADDGDGDDSLHLNGVVFELAMLGGGKMLY